LLDPRRDASKFDAAITALGLKATDDYTFQVTLSHRDPAFIWLAAMPAGAPIRQDIVKTASDKWATSPETLMTNGPFRVSEMATDHINVIQNAHYWGTRPTLTAIDFVIVNDGAGGPRQIHQRPARRNRCATGPSGRCCCRSATEP